ncbi:MAG: RES family NAD+ phosphorylase [Candidatus Eremiobacteraeota bacterium]|nr:RES family NAD+ phosphorylase [Candidatus Eremiobacteraeota bacterium]
MHATPPSEAYNGSGAERRGGRWNRIGTRAAYASSTRSLAALEYLAHVDADELALDLVFVGVAFHDNALESGNPPEGWERLRSRVAMDYGQTWLRSSRSPVLGVPSAIVKAERNYVINPAHAQAHTLAIDRELEEFVFDERLLTKP